MSAKRKLGVWYLGTRIRLLTLVWLSNKLFSIIPPYEFDTNIAKRVAPLTFVYVMMLALNNLCLKYVEVTFYQV